MQQNELITGVRYARPKDVAEELGVSERLLADWRATGTGPPWIRLPGGRGIRYDRDGFGPWTESQREAEYTSSSNYRKKHDMRAEQIAALTVLRAVEHRMRGDGQAMTQTLRGTSRQVSLRLCEAVEIIHHLLAHSDRSEQTLAALLHQVAPNETPRRVSSARVFPLRSSAEFQVNERTVPIMPSHADTAHQRDMLAGLRRRREAALRLPPLDCGCRDPWSCRHHDGPPSERQLDAYADAAEHLLDLGLTPGPDRPALQRMRRRGGSEQGGAMQIAERWELAA